MSGNTDIVYLNGEFIDRSEARISPDDRGFLFADGVYEVISCYGGSFFEPQMHMERLERSLRAISIEGVDTSNLIDAARALIRDNGLSSVDAKVYMQITRGAAPRNHAFPGSSTSPTIYACAGVLEIDQDSLSEGIEILLVPDNRWDRCDIKSIALLPNVLARQKAVEAGAAEAVFVRDGIVTEGAASSFAAVFGDALVTHPEGDFILGSITRKVVLDLCREEGMTVEERPINSGELGYAGEMMILSTTREITPVVKCSGKTVGSGRPGPMTRRIQKAFASYKRKISASQGDAGA